MLKNSGFVSFSLSFHSLLYVIKIRTERGLPGPSPVVGSLGRINGRPFIILHAPNRAAFSSPLLSRGSQAASLFFTGRWEFRILN